MKQLYIKLGLLIFLVFVIIKIVDRVCIQDQRYSAVYRHFFDKKEKYDYVYLGNSLTQRSFYVPELDSILNTKSINLGSTAQHFYVTHAIFDEIISDSELHPKKMLLIGVSPWQFKHFKKERLKYLQLPAIDELPYSKNYWGILRHLYSLEDYPKVLSSTVRFHDELPSKIETSMKSLTHKRSGTLGFDTGVTHTLNNEQRESMKDYKIMAQEYLSEIERVKPQSIDYKIEQMLTEIIDKSNNSNVNVLFYTPPALNMLYEKPNIAAFKYLEKFFKEKEVPYVNFNRMFNDLNLDLGDFSDLSHLNKYGNQKMNPLFMDSIVHYHR